MESLSRYFLGHKHRAATLGAGTLFLAIGIFVSLWLTGPYGSPGPTLDLDQAPGIGSKADQHERPLSPPAGNPTADQAPGGTVRPPKRTVAAHRQEDVEPLDNGAAYQVSVMKDLTDQANVSDSAQLRVQRGKTQPQGTSGDGATLRDSAELLVHDASGNVKQRETVR
ncbi:uncharacterized protein METZ01_LOCUS467275 [marine metagenome]|uniref:Uncharacterized protein n=1 Tax=marine metagenome TaxID=408172 RepID=A0A383B3G0_9ZZZZ